MPRLGSAKSSTGCTTCKIRRVKCDETHPACRRCTSTGRKCDGFPTGLIVKINPLSYQATAKPKQYFKIYVDYTQEQGQAYQFFVNRLAPYMTRVVSSIFWDKHVLQAALSDRSVWLAITAMSELVRHGRVVTDSDPPAEESRLSTALQWYMRSVSEMQKVIDNQSTWSNVCGITALIYFCIECLLENLQNARVIYERAVLTAVAAQSQVMRTTNQRDPVTDSTVAMFNHLAIAHGLRPILDQIPRSHSTTTFQNMHEARAVLELQLISEAHEFVDSIQHERLRQPRYWSPSVATREKGSVILARLKWWSTSTTNLRATDPHTIDTFTWTVLNLIQLNYVIWVTAMMEASETTFDAQHERFKQMLQYASVAIRTSGSIQPLFSFDTRVIPSLTFVATRCRDPTLRRKAVSLLHRGPRIENTRKASSAISLAQKVIAIEETDNPDAVYSDGTFFDELPYDINRLVWAMVERSEQNLRTKSRLRFGRWRMNECHEWYLLEELVDLVDC